MDNESNTIKQGTDITPHITDTAVPSDTAEEDNEAVKDVSASEKTVENEKNENSSETSDEKSAETTAAAETTADTQSGSKYRFDILKKLIIWVASVAVFLAVSGITVYYVTTASKGEFHADCTDTIMWANASAESDHVYDQSFTYACFLPFGTNLIMLPMLHFFGLSMTSHIIGMTCFFILFTLFMVLMIREVTGSLPTAFIGTSIFLSMTLSTQKMREIFWGHTIYYSLGILFLLIGTFLYFRILSVESDIRIQRKNGKNTKFKSLHKVLILVCLSLFMLLTGLDGITGITLFTIPLAGAVFAEHFVNSKQRIASRKSALIVTRVLVLVIMSVIGVIINNKLAGKLVASYQDANSSFSDMNSWMDHLLSLPIDWMKLLGVKDLPDVMFTDEKGIPNLIAILASLIIAVLPIIATCCYKKYGKDRRGRMMRIWIWIHWAVTAVNLMGYIFGVLSIAEWRIVPMIGTALILSILFVCYSVPKKLDVSRTAILLMIPVIAAGAISCNDVIKMKKDSYKQNTQYMLADFLKEEGMTKGYATFWNANSITVITGETIKVRDVYADSNGVYMRNYQSSKRWYATDPLQREYFLLLTGSEFDEFSCSSVYNADPPLRTAERVINGVDYILMVYDHNIVF